MRWQVRLQGKTFLVAVDGASVTVDGLPVALTWHPATAHASIQHEGGAAHSLRLRHGKTFSLGEGDWVSEMEVSGNRGDVTIARAEVSPHVPGAVKGGAGEKRGGGKVRAPMTGRVIRILVKEGDTVKSGDPLAILEAMKMENKVFADKPGRVARVAAKEGTSVAVGAELLTLE